MYVPTAGMGRYRGMGELNCPGDPGCPGYVAPGSADYQTSLLQAILANQVEAAGATPVVQSTVGTNNTFSSWLNANATTVGIGAAVVVGLFLFMGRR